MLSGQLISVCWFVFLFYWIANARFVKPAAEVQSVGSRLANRIPVWIGIVLLFFVGRHRAGVFVAPHTPLIRSLGVAIAVLGLAAAIWARRTLADNWSGNVVFKKEHKLIEQGPYRYVRHPIYTGILLMCLGTAIESGRPAAFAGVLFFLVGFWFKLQQEEKLMLRHFPQEYAAYKARVKALVPFVI